MAGEGQRSAIDEHLRAVVAPSVRSTEIEASPTVHGSSEGLFSQYFPIEMVSICSDIFAI